MISQRLSSPVRASKASAACSRFQSFYRITPSSSGSRSLCSSPRWSRWFSSLSSGRSSLKFSNGQKNTSVYSACHSPCSSLRSFLHSTRRSMKWAMFRWTGRSWWFNMLRLIWLQTSRAQARCSFYMSKRTSTLCTSSCCDSSRSTRIEEISMNTSTSSNEQTLYTL